MARYEQIRDRLPTLYRPDAGDDSLLTSALQAVAQVLDSLHSDAGLVMQAHWYDYADRALFDPFYRLNLQRSGKPVPTSNDSELLQFPYINDLARLGVLLPLSPWLEPPNAESVEQYRLRIQRIIALYKNGLGTLEALRRVIEAHLVVNLGAGRTADRPFWLEEAVASKWYSLHATTQGAPDAIVGPLMRWEISQDASQPVPLTVVIEGIEEEKDKFDATINPLIELYRAGGQKRQVGLAYLGTIPFGQALRLQPSYLSYLGTDTGLQRAQSLPGAKTLADPTAPGPWQPLGAGPTGVVTALCQTEDNALWAASGKELWRMDAKGWEKVLDGLPTVHCLAEDRQARMLLIGTEKGLLQLPVLADSTGGFPPQPDPGTMNDPAIYTLRLFSHEDCFYGTAAGAFRTTVGAPLNAPLLGDTAVYAIHQDTAGVIFFGCQQGLFQLFPENGRWYYYQGKEFTEQARDWQPLSLEILPGDGDVYLPPVHSILRSRDASLWLGTETGLARYIAQPVSGLAYQTLLQAFPDLGTGEIYTIAEDARGLVWFGAEHGLFRYDGRDFWQHQAGNWVQLGRADQIYPAASTPGPRGAWRYDRLATVWQRYDEATATWISPALESLGSDQSSVYCMTWCDWVSAELGTWDRANEAFTAPIAVDSAKLVMRIKKSERNVRNGGIPALPRLPVGVSTWRYLSMETRGYTPPANRPAFTVEGRFLPASLPPDPLIPPEKQALIGGDAKGAAGRYEQIEPAPDMLFDAAAFAYNPAARVWFGWNLPQPQTVLARLKLQGNEKGIDPLVMERVWQGINLVRPAGVKVFLAVENEIVRS